MVIVLFAISILVFIIFNVIPGGNPALLTQINKDFGFNDPLPVQYWTMMKQIFTGQLVSYSSQLNVDQQIVKGMPATFSLCIGAAVIWMAFAIVFGYLSAIHSGKFTDRALTIIALVGISMPVFLL